MSRVPSPTLYWVDGKRISKTSHWENWIWTDGSGEMEGCYQNFCHPPAFYRHDCLHLGSCLRPGEDHCHALRNNLDCSLRRGYINQSIS